MLPQSRYYLGLLPVLLIIPILSVLYWERGYNEPSISQELYTNCPEASLGGRLEQAELKWLAYVHNRREMLQALGLTAETAFFPTGEEMMSGKRLETVWDYFIPAYSCPWETERIGRLGSGGKWICGMSRYDSRAPIVYSFGVNNESSFEAEMLERTRGIVFGYDLVGDDFGPEVAGRFLPRTSYHRTAVGDEDDDSGPYPVRTLATIMRDNGHSYIDVLKVDIDGGEFKMFDRFLDDMGTAELPFGQLLIEIHLFADIEIDFPLFQTWWERLETFGLRSVSHEINLRQAVLREPRVAEFTWLNTATVNRPIPKSQP